jgi:hypothetical protein
VANGNKAGDPETSTNRETEEFEYEQVEFATEE